MASNESFLNLTSDQRAVTLQGYPADGKYRVEIEAFRVVDQDIDADGVIESSVAVAPASPYQPSPTVLIDESVKIGGLPAGQLVLAVRKIPTIQENIAATETDISNLFATYGNTESSSANKDAAEAAKIIAQVAATTATTAYTDSQAARDAARDAQNLASGFATNAAGSASGASSAASTANTAAAQSAQAKLDAMSASNAAQAASDLARGYSKQAEDNSGYSFQALAAAQIARDQSQAARDVANEKAADAAISATNANGFATTASGQATIATQKADVAGQSATIASAKADIATTKAGEAVVSSQNAATSESNALGSKNAAALSQTVTASNASAVNVQRAMMLPDRYDASGGDFFTDTLGQSGPPSTVVGVPSNATAAGFGPVISITVPQSLNGGMVTRGVFPAAAGRIYKIEFEWQRTAQNGTPDATTGMQPRVFGLTDAYVSSPGAIQPLGYIAFTGDVQTISYLVSDVADASRGIYAWPTASVWLRAAMRFRSGGSSGASVTVQGRRIAVTDVTQAMASAASAAASATSASNAATSKAGADQAASASQTSATNAQTARGQAETFASQASSSKDTAQGFAATATTQAGVATTASYQAGVARDQAGSANTQAQQWANDSRIKAEASAGSASTATTKADAAGQSATAAMASETSAGTSAGNASAKASEAATSASNALGSSNSASTSQSLAATSATDAQSYLNKTRTSAAAALLSEQSAFASQNAAGQSATAAKTSETNANTSAGMASTKATEASTSASNALGSANSASSSQQVAASNASQAIKTVGSTLPSDFSQGATFWRGGFQGTYQDPLIGGWTFTTDPVEGGIATNTFAGQKDISHRGIAPNVDGRKYRATIRIKSSDGPATSSFYAYLIRLNSDTVNAVETPLLAAVGVPAAYTTFTYDFDGVPASRGAYHRLLVRPFTDGSVRTISISRIDIEDITESVKAQAAATASAGSSSLAKTSETEAGKSASAAKTSETNAGTSAGTASTKATEASTSAVNAAGSANSASASQLVSTSSATLATQTAASTMPSDFSQGDLFWMNGFQGDSNARPIAAGWTFPTVKDEGIVAQGVTTSQRDISHRSIMPSVSGRKYRAVVRAKGSSTSAGLRVYEIQLAGQDVTASLTPLLINTALTTSFVDYTFEFTGGVGVPYHRLLARAMSFDGAVQTIQISRISLTDVTDVVAAQTAATASAGSASLAKTSETNAGSSASAALASQTAANTSAGNANTYAQQASSSATDALGSKNSAVLAQGVAATSAAAASAASKSTVPDNFTDANNWAAWNAWGGSVTFGNGLANIKLGGSFVSSFRIPIAAGETYRITARHRTINQGGGSTYIGTNDNPNGVAGGNAWWIAGKTTAPVGTWETTSFEVTAAQIYGQHGPVSAIGISFLTAHSGLSDAEVSLFRIENITSEKAARDQASASASSASSAAASKVGADQSASAANTSKTNADTAAGQASTSAAQASVSATNALGSANSAVSSATVAANAQSAAVSAASATLPANFDGTDTYWTRADRSADTAATSYFERNGSEFWWTGTVPGGRYVSVVSTGNKAAVVGRKYQTSVEVSSWDNGGVVAIVPGLVIKRGSSLVAAEVAQTITAPARGQFTTIFGPIYTAQAGDVWVSPRAIIMGGNFYVRNVTLYDVTEREAAASSATASASSASSAAASKTGADQSASAANTSATNAATKAGEASTSASNASTSASNASGSANTASTQASLASTAKAAAETARSGAEGAQSAAAGSASSANTSAGIASSKADTAGTSATAANQSKLDAEAANGRALASAQAANTSQVAATAAASSAQTSALISSSYSSGSSGVNDKFANWTNPSAHPNDWSVWIAGGNYRIERAAPGIGSQYHLRSLQDNQGVESGFYQTVTVYPGKWIFGAVVAIEQNANWNGSGLTLSGIGGDHSISFASEADDNGVTDAGLVNKNRSFSKLVTIGERTSINLHAMVGWNGFQTGLSAKYMHWYQVFLRPANAAEIAGSKALTSSTANAARIEEVNRVISTDVSSVATRTSTLESRAGNLESSVTTTQAAVSNLNGRTAAFWKVGAVAGDGRASLSVYADANGGGGVDIGGDVRISGSAIIDGTLAASKLRIAQRGISTEGIDFQTSIVNGSMELTWGPGAIRFTNGFGNNDARGTAGGNTYGTVKPAYIYWVEGESALRVTANSGEVYTNGNAIMIATYDGGTRFNANYGGTIVDGDRITTNSIQANRLNVSSLSAITANIGEVTAGLIRSADNTASLNLGTKRLSFSTGDWRVVQGSALGPNSNLVMWFGPNSVGAGSETIANSRFALANDGKTYYGAAELGLGGGVSKQTVGYETTLTKMLDVGASVSFEANVFKEAGGQGGTLQIVVYGGVSGQSLGVVGSANGSYVGPGEPGGAGITGTYTNNTGIKQAFVFQVSSNGLGGPVRAGQSYLSM